MKYRPVSVRVPELDIDAGRAVQPTGRIERRIVANLIAHLKKHGFAPVAVYDGHDETSATTTNAVMELVFNGPRRAWVYFKRKGYTAHGVRLVLGNGDCIVSDWRYATLDHDGFNAAMDAFNSDDWV